MKKRSWKDMLRPFVNQFCALVTVTDTNITRRPHHKGVLGSSRSGSHRETRRLFILDELCLKKGDETILLANRSAEIVHSSSDLDNQELLPILLKMKRDQAGKGGFAGTILVHDEPARLPARFLKSASSAQTLSTLEETATHSKDERIETRFLLGNEAIRALTTHSKPDMEHAQLFYALGELNQGQVGSHEARDLIIDPQARMDELYTLLQRASPISAKESQRSLIKVYQELMILLGYGEHQLVVAAQKILNPAKPDLPSPAISR